jgi:hypothetical protein
MKGEEDIATYFLRVDDIVNTVKGLVETMNTKIIVQKVLRTPPVIFDPKISTIE